MESVDIICSEFLNKESQPSKISNGAALHSQIAPQKPVTQGYNMNLSMGDSLRNFFNNNHTQNKQKPLLVTDQRNNNNCAAPAPATSSACHSNNNNNGVHNNLYTGRDFTEF